LTSGVEVFLCSAFGGGRGGTATGVLPFVEEVELINNDGASNEPGDDVIGTIGSVGRTIIEPPTGGPPPPPA